MDRKEFISSAAVGLAGTTMGGNLPFLERQKKLTSSNKGYKMFRESARDIPIVDEADVIVCGGGPAGFAAALAAARTGASVRLFELHGCLGGVWTAGMLAWVFDFEKPGITYEITQELDRRGARRGTNEDKYVYEIEEMKLLLEEKCVEAGVKFHLFTRVVEAYTNDNNRLTTILTESKSGRQAWKAKAFVDATGDGDLGALAGNGWDYGAKGTGFNGWDYGTKTIGDTQPMTYMSLIGVDEPEALSELISFYQGSNEHRKKTDAFHDELQRIGIEPSYGDPTLFQVRDNLIALMINHEYGVDPFDAEQMTQATVRGRAEVNKVVKTLRNNGGKRWDSIQLVATCEQIGVREGRRIHGRYTVTDSDLIMGVEHQDAIARVTFGVDIHAANFEKNKKQTISRAGIKTKPYDIPLRALIAKDVDGLLMAGRCISGDWVSFASYRVTGNAVAMGQAAGTLGALSAQHNQLPHQVPWEETEIALENIYEISEKKGQG